MDPQVGLSREQAEQVKQAFEGLLSAVRQRVDRKARLTNDLALVVKKGRVVGFKLCCEVHPPDELASLEWFGSLATCIAGLTGYGEVAAITNGIGDVVGGRIEASYVFLSRRNV